MGLLAKQAYSNSINIFIGVIAGAINTIFILPRAFETMPENWGLVKILLSYSVISAHVFGFGIYNIVIKEYSRMNDEKERASLMGFVFLISIVSILLLIFLNLITKGGIIHFINKEDSELIAKNLNDYFLLSAVVILTQLFTGFISSKHKTPVLQLVNETFLKSFYLIISLVYLFIPFSFDLYLSLFIWSYVISLLIYIFYSLYLGLKLEFSFRLLKIKETIIYGLYTVLDKGASIIVANLDLIMIGWILNLENVAYYTLAYYIGAVITIPQRAILIPATPMIAKSIHDEKHDEISKLYKQSSINQLIIGGALFLLIWVNIEALYQLIPGKFSGGLWVVFYIGLSNLFVMGTGVSGLMIVYSKYYRINLVFNSILILLTIISNYFLIKSYGIIGAAIATAITYFIYNAIKVIYIKWRFKSDPFSFSYFKTVLILLVIGAIGNVITLFPEDPILSVLIKTILFSLLLIIGFYGLKVKAEILDLPRKLMKKYFNS